MITVLGFTAGCTDFTDVDTPQSQLIAPDVFESTSTAEAAVTDIYARLREDGMVTGTLGGLSSLMSNYSDELEFYGSSTDIEQFNNHTIVPSNSLVASLWNGTYGEIYAVNAVLEGLQNATAIPQPDRERLMGEALFIRAYLHFYLVNIFGDVPYIATTDYELNESVAKTPQARVWQRLTNDLLQAESLLPETYPGTEKVRVNKGVAKAFLARVYLYQENWADAETKATEVINNPDYVWEQDPANEFLRGSSGTIWALHPGNPGLNTKDARTFVIGTGTPIKPALSAAFANNFEPGDLRRSLWVKTVVAGTGNYYCAFKYKKTLGTGTSQEYTILFRLAEQFLIRAEARAHLGNLDEALTDLNKIRSRAGLSDSPAVTQQEILDAIANERRMELFTEQGHRWLDLKRTAKAAEVLSPLKPNWQDTQTVLPIPQNELQLNQNLLPQNPGY